MTHASPPPPRNYFTVAEQEPQRRTRPIRHDVLPAERGLLTGEVELQIDVLSPLHVGGGAFEIDGDKLRKEPVRRRGTLVVPGSSIKGMCRQTYEVLSASGSPFDREEWLDRRDLILSSASALFGTLGYLGRLGFDDAVPATPIEPVAIQLSVGYPANKARGRRFYGRPPAGADQPLTVPVLAIPAGAKLTTRIRLRNVRREELGLVLLSLGVGRFTPRLGGGKYDHAGWVRFSPVGYRLRPPGFSRPTWETDRARVEKLTEECLAEVGLDDAAESALGHLAVELQVPTPGDD